MRSKIAATASNEIPATQFGGGFNSGSCPLAHLLARAQFDMALDRSLSLILFFIDVKTAFAAMVRSLAIPCDISDGILLDKLAEKGFSKEEALSIFLEIQDPVHFERVYGGHHFVRLMQSFCTVSWISGEALSGIIQPGCGTLAGTPLADMFFMVAFIRVLDRFEYSCAKAGLTSEFVVPRISEYFGFEVDVSKFSNMSIAYVDDVLKCVFCKAGEV
eukprot:3026367-Karenia_brevis.AAC.1